MKRERYLVERIVAVLKETETAGPFADLITREFPTWHGGAVSSDPLLRLEGDIHEAFNIIEAERDALAPGTGLILERSGEGRGEEWSVLTDILPDRRLDVATSQRGRRSFR